MSHDELMRALLAERFGAPVREYKPATRTAPVAELLDVLALDQAEVELTVIRGAG